MPEPDFDQIAAHILGDTVVVGRADAFAIVDAIAEQLRQVWNARGVADQEILDAKLAAQHDEIWRGVETHWVRKEAIEDLSANAVDAEARIADLTAQLSQAWNARGAADIASVLDNWDDYEINGQNNIEDWIRKVDR